MHTGSSIWIRMSQVNTVYRKELLEGREQILCAPFPVPYPLRSKLTHSPSCGMAESERASESPSSEVFVT